MTLNASFFFAACCICPTSVSLPRSAKMRGLLRPSRSMTANTPSCGPAWLLPAGGTKAASAIMPGALSLW
jgi:hypothetical protein